MVFKENKQQNFSIGGLLFFFFFFNDTSTFHVGPVVSDKSIRKDVVWRCLLLNVAGQRKRK